MNSKALYAASDRAINLASRHIQNDAAMQSSAVLCLKDAVKLANSGDYKSAKIRALKSLRYSVGVFHPDYADALLTVQS